MGLPPVLTAVKQSSPEAATIFFGIALSEPVDEDDNLVPAACQLPKASHDVTRQLGPEYAVARHFFPPTRSAPVLGPPPVHIAPAAPEVKHCVVCSHPV